MLHSLILLVALILAGRFAWAGGNDQGGNGGGGKAALTAQWMWSIARMIEEAQILLNARGLSTADPTEVFYLRQAISRLPMLFCEGRKSICGEVFSGKDLQSPFKFVTLVKGKQQLLLFNQKAWDAKTIEQKFQILLQLYMDQMSDVQREELARSAGQAILEASMREWVLVDKKIKREDHISSKGPRELAIGMKNFLQACTDRARMSDQELLDLNLKREVCIIEEIFFRKADAITFKYQTGLRVGVPGTDLSWPVAMSNLGFTRLDDAKIWVDMEKFESMNALERVALMAHEVMTLALMDKSHNYINGAAFGGYLINGLNEYFKRQAASKSPARK